MDFNEYQQITKKWENSETSNKDRLINGALGLAGESGKVIDLIKKRYFHRHDLDERKLVEELGDVLWYVAQIARASGIGLQFIVETNIQKLQKRYPEGFSSERSINREV